MIYAPIIIPTLCRYEHFVRCIESLKKNRWASKTDVYIALDYPLKSEHEDGYHKICDYLRGGGYEEFKNFTVVKRKINYGSEKNFSEICDWVLTKYDRFIRTDDDIEFSPNFIEYMDKCLMEYEKDPEVVAVSGYSHPIRWMTSKGSTCLKQNCVCSMWGTGFWKEKYYQLKNLLCSGYFKNNADKLIRSKSFNGIADARLISFSRTFSADKNDLMFKMTDVSVGAYISMTDKWVISPVKSKSRNWGFDGTGEYCGNIKFDKAKKMGVYNYNYRQQDIDTDDIFDLVKDELCATEENIKIYNQFHYYSKKQIFFAKLRISARKILGYDRYVRLSKLKK